MSYSRQAEKKIIEEGVLGFFVATNEGVLGMSIRWEVKVLRGAPW